MKKRPAICLGLLLRQILMIQESHPQYQFRHDLLEEGAKLFIHDPRNSIQSDKSKVLNESFLNCPTKMEGIWEFSQNIDNVQLKMLMLHCCV